MKNRLTFALLFISLLSLQFCSAQDNPKLTPVITRLGSQLTADLNSDNLHGSISVAILKNDKLLWAGAFGYADREKDILADNSTIYRIGSITKTFTATLLMQLVAEGKVKLDDPAENYVPEIKLVKGYAEYGVITLRQLASHTSGLNREPDLRGADVGPLNEWENKVLACLPHASFAGKPGTQFLYSNIGYAILGLALERATGVPYLQMVQQKIFTPLHMDDTFFELPEDKRSLLAQGMSNKTKGDVNVNTPLREIAGRGYRVPNGGIFSTPADLSKFVMSAMGLPPLLNAESRQQMQTIPTGGSRYGLGLMIVNNHIYGHNGSVPGYTSQFLIDKNTGYAVILMRNYNFGVTSLEGLAIGVLKELKAME